MWHILEQKREQCLVNITCYIGNTTSSKNRPELTGDVSRRHTNLLCGLEAGVEARRLPRVEILLLMQKVEGKADESEKAERIRPHACQRGMSWKGHITWRKMEAGSKSVRKVQERGNARINGGTKQKW